MDKERRQTTDFNSSGTIANECHQARRNDTRLLQRDCTRMLDPAELKFVVARQTKCLGKKRLGLALLAAGGVALLSMLLLMLWPGSEYGQFNESTIYHDPDFGFEIGLSKGWQRSRGKINGVESFFKINGAGEQAACLDILTETQSDFRWTGLTQGWQKYFAEMKVRFKELEIVGQRSRSIYGAAVINFDFVTDQYHGRGLFTLDGDKRIVIIGYAPKPSFNEQASQLAEIIEGFRLVGQQMTIDYPLPDEQMFRLAMGQPGALLKMAEDAKVRGEEWLEERSVRPDNLYRAIQELKKSLQATATIMPRPDVFISAAILLQKATWAFDEAVSKQRFEINQAYKRGDYATAYWAARRLMQMVPEKTDNIYQEARRWEKALGALQ